ncbi:biotin--[acetyl-CoA-carboxylase] ligase [Actinoplanes friuliensis]|uniref:biotin--[biotin carboxyl-carrier protein] ligase n=1 Tax=Actinoplanes friuliensis DSM 7358 TaxID=1246995 RepID=U5WAU5_9ACTN|nr:biotin--[acetyl-CoA-carboxylase] ligase [Actinoplanes friuliensis]AGZ46117.1 putative biotin apo-protein ligase [Actinoplanes friuliensis DSM 7358]
MASSPYTDLDRPPLAERALQRALVVPGGLWQRVEVRTETGSTNADAAAAARDGAAGGLVIVAEQQVAGRGRRDRQWVSPARAGLTLSIMVRPGAADAERGWAPAPQRTWGWLPLMAGVALLETVQRLAELDASLKWPNDLLISTEAGDAKAAGILAEVAEDAVVVGIGLNVTTRPEELPTTGLQATSLQTAGAKATDRDPLLRSLLRGVAQWYVGWREAEGDAEMCGLLAAYQRGCSTVGRDVRVLLPNGEEFTGSATTVDGDGRLVVLTADGERRVSAGDVLHVR